MLLDFTFDPPAWDGSPQLIEELWRLTKDGRTAFCILQTHPTRRADLRCFVDAEPRESRAENDLILLSEMAEEWRKGFEAEGWRADPFANALTHRSTADIRSPFDDDADPRCGNIPDGETESGK